MADWRRDLIRLECITSVSQPFPSTDRRDDTSDKSAGRSRN
jgi:hypothetical protein